MDYRDYSALYKQLVVDRSREKLGDDKKEEEAVVGKINQFLSLYPGSVPPDKRPDAAVVDISLRELFRRTLQTAIDIIHDISSLVTERDALSRTEMRRRVFRTIMEPQRRLYVGVWLVFLSFVLYFIDSAA